jgi:hypothetical protein
MSKIQGLVAAAMTTFALACTSAHAATVWDFSFSDVVSGHAVTGAGTFTTTGNGATPSDVTAVTGTYSDGTTANGALSLIPATATGGVRNTSADGHYWYDNVYGGTPGLDMNGILFLAGSQEVNLYYENGTFNIVTSYNNGASFDITPVNFAAAAVPEPASIAMLLAGLGALGVASRRKMRQ